MSVRRLGPLEYANREMKLASIKKYGARKVTPVAKVAPAKQVDNGVSEQIGRTCAVLSCEEWKALPHDFLFSFPEEPSLRKVWTEMTGRVNWIPNDYSYVCVEHFTKDCVNVTEDSPRLDKGSVPTVKLPGHVMEIEYIDEEILDKEEIEPKQETPKALKPKQEIMRKRKVEPKAMPSESEDTDNGFFKEVVKRSKPVHKVSKQISLKPDLIKLFSDVQRKQKQIVSKSKKLRHDKLILKHHRTTVEKLKQQVALKEALLANKLPKITEDDLKKTDTDSIILMPTKYTDEAKNFALSVYNYSPEAYTYLRNTLRTMLPSTDVLTGWLGRGFLPTNVMSIGETIKVVTETKDKEMACRVIIEQ